MSLVIIRHTVTYSLLSIFPKRQISKILFHCAQIIKKDVSYEFSTIPCLATRCIEKQGLLPYVGCTHSSLLPNDFTLLIKGLESSEECFCSYNCSAKASRQSKPSMGVSNYCIVIAVNCDLFQISGLQIHRNKLKCLTMALNSSLSRQKELNILSVKSNLITLATGFSVNATNNVSSQLMLLTLITRTSNLIDYLLKIIQGSEFNFCV